MNIIAMILIAIHGTDIGIEMGFELRGSREIIRAVLSFGCVWVWREILMGRSHKNFIKKNLY